MYGFSFYLNNEVDQLSEKQLRLMKQVGFSGLFTSLHIPEDDATLYRKRIKKLGELAKNNQLDLMVDISGGALEKAGFSIDHLSELVTMGITGLRMDDGFSMETIADCSHQMQVGLNASTITENELTRLRQLAADFQNLSVWHNYYPRPETGLDRQWFFAKNEWLRQEGLTVQAFIPGDGEKRGPLKAGLPTLEEHRNCLPLAAALDLEQLGVDFVYVGDPTLSAKSLAQFKAWLGKQRILLTCQLFKNASQSTVLGVHYNRPDVARDVVRSRESRRKRVNEVQPLPSRIRELGAITVDNSLYGRYMGELQLCKRNLLADERVNVVGQLVEEDFSLLPFIGANQEFELVEKEVTTHE